MSPSSITTPAADRVVWLSGQSSPDHAALAPGQRRLLAAAEGFDAVPNGYPFPAQDGPWRPTGLLGASARNARQFLALRRDAGAPATVAARLDPLFALTSDRLLVVCGSLGLELLLVGLAGRGPVGGVFPHGPRLRVVALGPVSGPVPDDLDAWIVQGRRDLLTRLAHRGPPRWRPHCGHLGYTTHPQVLALVGEAARSPW